MVTAEVVDRVECPPRTPRSTAMSMTTSHPGAKTLTPSAVSSAVATAGALSRLPPLKIGPHAIACPVILAPMAGVSEAPYRVIAGEMGAGLAPTELVSAKGLEYANARTENYLKHDPKLEPLLSVQIFGGDPASMARGAKLAMARGAKMLDINMGCPVKKVTRNGAGSALMTDPARAAAIVEQMRAAVDDAIPITAKIRAGWDHDHKNAAEVGKALEGAGLAAIAIHPRTRTQGYSGHADWSITRGLKEAVSIPVIANGDIWDVDAAHRCVEETGCDALMIGRAALGNPWIFRELAAVHAGRPCPPKPSPSERVAVVLRHLSENIEHIGDEERAIKKFRQHLIWYSRGMRGGGPFREKAMQLETRAAVEDTVAAYFGGAQMSDQDETPIYDERTAFG